MSSVVVTGTGLVTAAGLGHDPLEQALAAGLHFVREQADGSRGYEIPHELLFWPDQPEWEAAREYAGLAARLALTACHYALGSAASGAGAFDPERSATVAVTGDDWTGQQLFDRALANAASVKEEARTLFSELDDEFLLRTFRWGVGFGIGSLTGFQGPSVGIDCPCFGGLAGLRHAVDLIESGEVDAVMLVGVDTKPRLDMAVSLEQLADEAGAPALSFGQGAAALMLERSSSASERGARPLAHVLDCRLVLDEQIDRASTELGRELATSRRFSSGGALGTLFNCGALVDACLTSQWLSSQKTAGRSAVAYALAEETLGARGAGFATFGTAADSAALP